MPVTFGQEEPITQVSKPLAMGRAQPDFSTVSRSFDGRKEPEKTLDLRMAQAPIPFHPEQDQFWPEGCASAMNAVLTDQQNNDVIPRIRGIGNEPGYLRIQHDKVFEEETRAPIRGFLTPRAPFSVKVSTAQPMDTPVARLDDDHIVSVLVEPEKGFRAPETENVAAVSRSVPLAGSSLYGRRYGWSRQENPKHLKAPRRGVVKSTPPVPGTDYTGYKFNGVVVPEHRRLPNER